MMQQWKETDKIEEVLMSTCSLVAWVLSKFGKAVLIDFPATQKWPEIDKNTIFEWIMTH